MNFNNSDYDDEENSDYEKQSLQLQSRLQEKMNLCSDSEHSSDEENNLQEFNGLPKQQEQQQQQQQDDDDDDDDDNDEEEQYDQVNQLEQPQISEEDDSSGESYEDPEEQAPMESKIPPSRFQKRQIIQRPATATGVRKVLTQSNVMQKSLVNNNNMQKSQLPQRPQTSYLNKENQLTQSTFKPVYTQSFQSYNMQNKNFNYSQKKFKTVAKRSDPVAKFQSFNNSWKKTKFLQSNATKGKEGRKLNLSERIQSSKPEEIFYRYLPKYAYF